MKTLKELIRFAEELSSADKILCDAVAEGTYRLGGDFSEPVKSMLRYVFNDLIGHQEKIDLSMFEGLDPQEYLSALFMDLIENKGSGRDFWELREDEEVKRFAELSAEIEKSLVFQYFTVASRRDEERLRLATEKGKEVVSAILSDVSSNVEEEEIKTIGLGFIGYDPLIFNFAEQFYSIFAIRKYRPYESKLIVEIPYCEFIAVLKRGKFVEDYFNPFGIENDEDARKAIKELEKQKDLPREIIQHLSERLLNWRWYKISSYGLAIFYSQAVVYNRDAFDNALDILKRLNPEKKVEHLVVARVWENLGRNMEDRQFLRKASEYYQKAGNLVKALECEVL